jgi:hypothetical protein
MHANPIQAHSTATIRSALRARATSLINLSADSLRKAIETTRSELAEREERTAILQATYDAECAARRLGRLSDVPAAADRLDAERREVAYLQATVRGLEAALTGREA